MAERAELAPVSRPYPARMDGRLDQGLSRWLWLVKWLLAIPHFVVLVFLWIAFFVVSVIAFFAIVVTGRYPRSLFDFNVGVMRWSWRVNYYSYGALGTDKYPPFTLAEVPDYPATFQVDYPDHLSRGLVLVKWWLLAIPHYVIVGFFVSGGSVFLWQSDVGDYGVTGTGLIGILVFIAAIVLLVTGRYPHGLFDLIVGLNRWALRVAAYAGLMTDRYPPFRLDMGGTDPGTAPITDPDPSFGASEAPPPPHPSPGKQWTAGRVVALIVGIVMALVSLGLLTGGIAALAVDRSQKDDDGYINTHSERLDTDTYALVADDIDLGVDGPDWLYAQRVLGDVRLRVSGNGQTPAFIGVARERAAATYLAALEYAEVTDLGESDPTLRTHLGDAPSGAPTDESFWTEMVSGVGSQELVWQPSEGSWVFVAMNADGSAGVDVNASVGAELPILGWIGVTLIVIGLVLLAGAAIPIYLAARSPRR